jgi:hypothetical protein
MLDRKKGLDDLNAFWGTGPHQRFAPRARTSCEESPRGHPGNRAPHGARNWPGAQLCPRPARPYRQYAVLRSVAQANGLSQTDMLATGIDRSSTAELVATPSIPWGFATSSHETRCPRVRCTSHDERPRTTRPRGTGSSGCRRNIAFACSRFSKAGISRGAEDRRYVAVH